MIEKAKSRVTIYHQKCGHTAERVIIHKYQDHNDKQKKMNMYKKRVKCPECEHKEMYGNNG